MIDTFTYLMDRCGAATEDSFKEDLLNEIDSLESAIVFYSQEALKAEQGGCYGYGNAQYEAEMEVETLKLELAGLERQLLILKDRGFKELILSEMARKGRRECPCSAQGEPEEDFNASFSLATGHAVDHAAERGEV